MLVVFRVVEEMGYKFGNEVSIFLVFNKFYVFFYFIFVI